MKNIDYKLYLNMSPKELKQLQQKKGWVLSAIGWLVYGALRLCGLKPIDYYGICPCFELGTNWGGVSFGWFFVCCKNASECIRNHEVGHCIQNAAVGGLTMLAYSIGSVVRYWWRKITKAKTPYDSWFFEGDATRFGTEYVNNIKEKETTNE